MDWWRVLKKLNIVVPFGLSLRRVSCEWSFANSSSVRVGRSPHFPDRAFPIFLRCRTKGDIVSLGNPGSQMQIQERDGPLRQLSDGYDRAQRGEGNCIVVQGEAGIGKTTLLRAFLETLPEGPRVLRGSCEDLAIAEPLGPLWDLAREVGWDLEKSIGGPGGRIAAFSQALSAITALMVPTLIVIEDLHWADIATVDFLKFLARRLDGRRLLLVLTVRDDDPRGRGNVRQMLAGVSLDRVSRIELTPLSRSAIARLAQGTGLDAAAVFRITSGNAFYVSEVLKSGFANVPASVEDAVLARLESLSHAARSVAEAAAIFPRRGEAFIINQMIGHDAEQAVEECVLGGILHEQEGYLAFRHEIARQAVAASLAPSLRKKLHAQCLRILEAEGSTSSARRLHHARQVGDQETLRHLAPQAAREALDKGAVREACEYFDLALEYARPGSDLELADLLEQAAWANYLVGTNTRSIAQQAAALKIYQAAGDSLRAGDSYRKMSRFHWLSTKIARARELGDTAVRLLAGHRGPELAMALSNQAQLLMLDRAYSQVGGPARAAIALAREFGRPDIEAHALNNLGMSLAVSDPEAGRQMLGDSIAIAMRLGDTDNVARGYTNAAYYEMDLHNLAAAEALARKGIAYCTEHELDGYRIYITGELSWMLIRQGRWDEAESLTETGFTDELLPDEDIQFFMAGRSFTGACAISWLAARRGEPIPMPVTRFLEAFMAGADELQRLEVHAALLGELAWLGLVDRGTALMALRSVTGRAENIAFVPEPAVWLKRLDPTSEIRVTPELAPAYRLELEGDWAGAAEVWAGLGTPFEEAMSLAQGDEEAQRRAVSILTRLGATATANRIRADMRQEGVADIPATPRTSTRNNPLGLTNRQLEVLRSLNDGLSNTEIAERLFVSPKTIDHHVSAILGKLEVATRGEAAAKARRLGIF